MNYWLSCCGNFLNIFNADMVDFLSDACFAGVMSQCLGSAVSSELSNSVVTSDDCSRTTDDDFDDQPSPAELSDLCKVRNIVWT